MNWFVLIAGLLWVGSMVWSDKKERRAARRNVDRVCRLESLLRQARNGLTVAVDSDERWRAQRDAVVAAIDEAIGRDR